MHAIVRNYKIGVCRGVHPGPVRTLDFDVDTLDDRLVEKVFIHFYDKPQSTLGFMNLVNNTVAIFLPRDDFETICGLLQSPHDVFVSWVEDVDCNLVWAEVTTSEHTMGPVAHLEEPARKLQAIAASA